MSSILIDLIKANEILLSALKDRKKTNISISSSIKKVMLGSHKTYKYILVTNLLAKSVNPQANALCLQAKAQIEGAFDSRSLCHKVVVPFEREHLSMALGGSNEPYLNKPARFTHLSRCNAVRNGNDRIILNTLISVLEYINDNTPLLAYDSLSYCLLLLEKIIANNELLRSIHTIITPDIINIYTYISRFINEPLKGESCVIVVGAVERQFYACLKGSYRVDIHNVNECGSSSKEVGDIDIYEDDKCFYSIEIKDKSFTVYDVDHAFNKMIASNVSRGSFLYGPRATFDDEKIKITLYNFEQKKFVTLFMEVLKYVRMVLFKTPEAKMNHFFQLLLDISQDMNASENAIKRIHKIYHDLFDNH